jgi:hypothetical protein
MLDKCSSSCPSSVRSRRSAFLYIAVIHGECCGPSGLAGALKKGLKGSWNCRLRFHQEAFELR